MSTITTRAGKGSPLTNSEIDSNFTELNNDKAELSGADFTGPVSITGGNLDVEDLVHAGAFSGNGIQVTDDLGDVTTTAYGVGQVAVRNLRLTPDASMFAGITLNNLDWYAVNFGLSGNELVVGGYSMGAVKYKIHHDGPLNGAAVLARDVSGSGALSTFNSALQVGLHSTTSGDSNNSGTGPSVLFFAFDNATTGSDGRGPKKEFIGRISGYIESAAVGNFYGGISVNVRENNADSSAQTTAARWKANKNLVQEGYTQLGGSSAPAIKHKKITGTTAATEGGSTSVAHGLTGSKIIGFDCKVVYTTNAGMPPGHTHWPGYQYDVYHDGTNFVVINHATNSELILSKNFSILVTYEE